VFNEKAYCIFGEYIPKKKPAIREDGRLFF